MEAQTVELMLQYIYGCMKSELDLPEVMALFEASDKYAIISLHEQCTRLLKALISFDNIFDLVDLAQLHQSPGLLQVRQTRFVHPERMLDVLSRPSWVHTGAINCTHQFRPVLP